MHNSNDESTLKSILKATSIVNPPIIDRITPTPHAQCNLTAVADTGASSHYVRDEDKMHVVETPPSSPGPLVTLPNAETAQATSEAFIPLSNQLSKQAQTGHILPALKSSSLLSMGQLCDDGCDVVFRKQSLHLLKDTKAMDCFLKTQHCILNGKRNLSNRLWDITLNTKSDAPHHSIVLPTPHAGIYPSRNKPPPRPELKRQRQRKQQCRPDLFSDFQAMDLYLSTQECTHLVEQQLKQDRNKSIPKQYHNPFQGLNTLIDENMTDKYTTCKVSHTAN